MQMWDHVSDQYLYFCTSWIDEKDTRKNKPYNQIDRSTYIFINTYNRKTKIRTKPYQNLYLKMLQDNSLNKTIKIEPPIIKRNLYETKPYIYTDVDYNTI